MHCKGLPAREIHACINSRTLRAGFYVDNKNYFEQYAVVTALGPGTVPRKHQDNLKNLKRTKGN